MFLVRSHLLKSNVCLRNFNNRIIPGAVTSFLSNPFNNKLFLTWQLIMKIQIYRSISINYRTTFQASPLNPRNHKTDSFESSQEIKSEFDKTEPVPVDFGAFKLINRKQVSILNVKLESLLTKLDHITTEDWNDLKSSVLSSRGSINEKNIDAVIMKTCSEVKCLALGKSFFKYLQWEKEKINLATYGNYFRLFFDCSSSCTEEDLSEIYTLYKHFINKYPQIDNNTAENLICALSLTEHWKEYEVLFEKIKLFYLPSVFAYSVVIKTAFANQEFSLGWRLIEEIHLQNRVYPVFDEVFLFWLNEVQYTNKEEGLRTLLDFLSRFSLKPSFNVCKEIKAKYESINQPRKGTFTSISRSGECRNCHTRLEPAAVSQEDFNELKRQFLNPVLIGKDIFQKTRPEEFNEFLKLLENTAPYDVVLDGLNIALKAHKTRRTPAYFAFQLQSVVRHFATQKKRILVLGRKHMSKWPTALMKDVYDNAEVFFSDDLSEDDPFLLYAAIYSGLGTYFVSRDMMRSHKFLLGKPNLQATFQKWQAQYQYFLMYIEPNGIVHLQKPVPFMQTVHQNTHGNWHIPYTIKETLTDRSWVDNFHKHWLCLADEMQTKQAHLTGTSSQSKGNGRPPYKKQQARKLVANIFSEDS